MPLGEGSAITADAAAAADFAALMARFAPFEPRPHLAVAVSGGSDSMALTLLAHDWARARGGAISALTVDHGLRPEAAAEAAQVGAWCAAHGIDHVILTRGGPAPTHGIQAFARAARYRLLADWCRAHFVLHLLLAHQREDQAETLVMREASGSGADGRAGMAAIVEHGALRLLRPLLGTPRAQLRGYLAARGQEWIEDPSNRNPAFTRVRIRDALERAAPGLAAAACGGSAAARHGAGAARGRGGAAPGALRHDRSRRLRAHRAERFRRDRRRSGSRHSAPSWRRSREARFRRAPNGSSGFTASLRTGCRGGGARSADVWSSAWRGRTLLCREPAAIARPLPLRPGEAVRWDGRFQITLGTGASAGLAVGALGRDAAAIARETAKSAAARLPAAVRAGLPALRDAKGVVAVPTLGYFKCCREEAETAACRVQFWPVRSLTGAGFTIV